MTLRGQIDAEKLIVSLKIHVTSKIVFNQKLGLTERRHKLFRSFEIAKSKAIRETAVIF